MIFCTGHYDKSLNLLYISRDDILLDQQLMSLLYFLGLKYSAYSRIASYALDTEPLPAEVLEQVSKYIYLFIRSNSEALASNR